MGGTSLSTGTTLRFTFEDTEHFYNIYASSVETSVAEVDTEWQIWS
jgi:hypothetical protein